jgi:hypothetical protein
MLAKWVGPGCGILFYDFYACLEEGAFDFRQLNIHDIAGCATLQEDDQSVDTGNALALGRHGFDDNIFYYVSFFH